MFLQAWLKKYFGGVAPKMFLQAWPQKCSPGPHWCPKSCCYFPLWPKRAINKLLWLFSIVAGSSVNNVVLLLSSVAEKGH